MLPMNPSAGDRRHSSPRFTRNSVWTLLLLQKTYQRTDAPTVNFYGKHPTEQGFLQHASANMQGQTFL